MKLNPYQILGLKPPVSFSEMEKAYKKCLVQYHPDKFHHLGPEFSSLARAKLRMAHEAYSYLREGEWKQISRGKSSFDKFRFEICPHCAHVHLGSHSEEFSKECENCHSEFHVNGQSEYHFRSQLLPLLKFIELSHEIEKGDQLASHLEISLNQSQITLDLMPGRYWYLFTNSQSLHNFWRQNFPQQTQNFDHDLQTGFVKVELLNLPQLERELLNLLNQILQQKDVKAKIIPSHRKRGVAEPNAMLLSALNNISMVNAQDIWEKSGSNLLECGFEMISSWEKRLAALFHLVFSHRRKSPVPLLYSEESREEDKIQVYDAFTLRQSFGNK